MAVWRKFALWTSSAQFWTESKKHQPRSHPCRSEDLGLRPRTASLRSVPPALKGSDSETRAESCDTDPEHGCVDSRKRSGVSPALPPIHVRIITYTQKHGHTHLRNTQMFMHISICTDPEMCACSCLDTFRVTGTHKSIGRCSHINTGILGGRRSGLVSLTSRGSLLHTHGKNRVPPQGLKMISH